MDTFAAIEKLSPYCEGVSRPETRDDRRAWGLGSFTENKSVNDLPLDGQPGALFLQFYERVGGALADKERKYYHLGAASAYLGKAIGHLSIQLREERDPQAILRVAAILRHLIDNAPEAMREESWKRASVVLEKVDLPGLAAKYEAPSTLPQCGTDCCIAEGYPSFGAHSFRWAELITAHFVRSQLEKIEGESDASDRVAKFERLYNAAREVFISERR